MTSARLPLMSDSAFLHDQSQEGLNFVNSSAFTKFTLHFFDAQLGETAGLFERQSRVARKKVLIRSVTDRANEIGFDARAAKKFRIYRVVVKAGHWPAVQPECACWNN